MAVRTPSVDDPGMNSWGMVRLVGLRVARIALIGWMLVAAILAVGSLVANPAPFVALSFSVGALPL